MSEDQRAIERNAEQDYDAQIADAAERVRIQASIADRALQAAVLANGGALVALFTFVNNGAARLRFDPHEMKMAFGGFALGLGLALFAHIFAFASQDRFYNAAMLEARRHQRTLRTGVEDLDLELVIGVHRKGMIGELGRRPLRRCPYAREHDREHEQDLTNEQLGWGHEEAPPGADGPPGSHLQCQPVKPIFTFRFRRNRAREDAGDNIRFAGGTQDPPLRVATAIPSFGHLFMF